MRIFPRLIQAACLLCCTAALTAWGNVTETPITLSQHKYYFENAVFDDGGRIEGWFIYDADAGIIVNSQIITTPATTLTLYERYNFLTQEVELAPEFGYEIDYSGLGTVFNPHLIQVGVASAYINLALADSLAETSDRIDLVTGSNLSGSYESIQVQAFPFAFPGYPPIHVEERDLISGALTTQLSAVPEPSSFATFAALCALGFVTLRRRRAA